MWSRIRQRIRSLDGSFLAVLGVSSSDLGSGGFSSLFWLVDVVAAVVAAVVADVVAAVLLLGLCFSSAYVGRDMMCWVGLLIERRYGGGLICNR